MTYKPFQEPATDVLEVVRTRTWQELRRASTAINKTGERAYLCGETVMAAWAPGVTTATIAARIPLQTAQIAKGVSLTSPKMIVNLRGDFTFDVRIRFQPAVSTTWNLAAFKNNAQMGTAHVIVPTTSQWFRSLIVAGTAVPTSTFDIRLWPAVATDSGTITLCEFLLRAEYIE